MTSLAAIVIGALAIAATGYQLLAIVACLSFRRQRPAGSGAAQPAVSILKPVNGVEPSMERAIASHANLNGDYEFLCGVRPGDPAAGVIAKFPKAKLVESRTKAPNGKVGVLIDLERAATKDVLVVNDADIRVEPDYLTRVTAPLADPSTGLVTCLYRAEGATFAARFEGLGIATEFAPSTLVARFIGVDKFAMGSTMAFRKETLERIGGFETIAPYLADDFQLGAHIHALGLKCVLSDVIVTTHLGGNWSDVWKHQLRWARTIRVSNTAGYLGLPLSFATVWALVAALAGMWTLAGVALGARMVMATVAGWGVLGSRDTLKLWPLIPVRDLFGAAVWVAGCFGRSVEWRGRELQLDAAGRILGG